MLFKKDNCLPKWTISWPECNKFRGKIYKNMPLFNYHSSSSLQGVSVLRFIIHRVTQKGVAIIFQVSKLLSLKFHWDKKSDAPPEVIHFCSWRGSRPALSFVFSMDFDEEKDNLVWHSWSACLFDWVNITWICSYSIILILLSRTLFPCLLSKILVIKGTVYLAKCF